MLKFMKWNILFNPEALLHIFLLHIWFLFQSGIIDFQSNLMSFNARLQKKKKPKPNDLMSRGVKAQENLKLTGSTEQFRICGDFF